MKRMAMVVAVLSAAAGLANGADLCRLDRRETLFVSPENPKGSRGGGHDDAPSVVLDLPPSGTNCRNSEGDFVRLKDGRILFVYSHFTKGTGADGDPAYLASRESSDGGRTWTTNSLTVVANEAGQNVMSVSLLRLKSGAIALFYGVKNSDADCRPVMRLSTDEAKTWGPPIPCVGEADKAYYVLNNCRVHELANGRLVLPLCKHETMKDGKNDWNGKLVCYLSDDAGRTWRRSRAEPFATFDAEGKRVVTQEPGLVTLKDGRVLMYARTNRGLQWACLSSDNCETWTKCEPWTLWSPCSPATVKRLRNGDLLAVWNDHENRPDLHKQDVASGWGTRVPMSLALSRDDGRTWPIRKTLADDPKGWYCYTAVLELEDRLLLGYCALQGLRELHVSSVPISWLCQSPEPVNVLDFGAVADGVTDSTEAFQKAVDSLGGTGGRVVVPAGQYVVGEIALRPGVTVLGAAGYSYRKTDRGTTLHLRKDSTSRTLFDLTGAYGAGIRDLALVGAGLSETGRVVHGVALLKPDFGKQEDYFLVDHCVIRNFSGDGIHLQRVWCGHVRSCLVLGNGGDGIRLMGWDIFIIDNELSGNGGCGYHGVPPNCSGTITANRIEWNRCGGMLLEGGSHYCITGNYFDRSGVAGVRFEDAAHITFTGNQIYRSGKPEWARADTPHSAHAVLARCRGVTFSSNNLVLGRDDGGKGGWSPKTGLVLTNLVDSAVIGNTGSGCALEKFVDDRGGHENAVIRDNVGSVFK